MTDFNKRLNKQLIGLAEQLNQDKKEIAKKAIEMIEKGGFKYV